MIKGGSGEYGVGVVNNGRNKNAQSDHFKICCIIHFKMDENIIN